MREVRASVCMSGGLSLAAGYDFDDTISGRLVHEADVAKTGVYPELFGEPGVAGPSGVFLGATVALPLRHPERIESGVCGASGLLRGRPSRATKGDCRSPVTADERAARAANE